MSLPSEYFKDKTVFVTGCTGLVGQLLIEKLIRLNVHRIFVLVRPKKGISPIERMTALFGTPIFADPNNNVAENKKISKKIRILEGDLAENNFNLSSEDQNLLTEETEIVFHAAAHVRFDDCLKDCVTINVKATRELLLMAEKMTKLSSFVYVSTAFAQMHHKLVSEKFYPASICPDIMIKALELFENEDYIDTFTQKIIAPHVNSYTFSKTLAEELINRWKMKLPVCVVRPSIILTTHKEPFPGYTSNFYGINGIICGVGFGIMRVTNIGPETLSDIVPADYVSNFILLAAWNQTQKTSREVVFNCCANEKSVTNKFVGDKSVEIGKTMPLKRSLWKICYTSRNFHGFFCVVELFYHILPAFLFDFLLILQRRKPKIVKIYRKIAKFQNALGQFFNRDYKFDNTNMKKVIDEVKSEQEREIFQCDIRNINWDEFWPFYIKGMRRYLMKEDDDTIEEALKRHKLLTIVHNFIFGVIYLQILYIFVKLLL
ncbi:fatty acyl-CoA reductase wat-like [Culicoides brevitarsis]|uniref:fatty acyl-CoA reductase wat-like n=1 Tax=Culicoides brevitarsis TaxID=469753 RepID=UPI00307B4767